MIIKDLLTKVETKDIYFVQQLADEDPTLVVLGDDPLNAYDINSGKTILGIGFFYKVPFSEYVSTNEQKISLFKAKRLAKPFYSKFLEYIRDEEDFKHPERIKHRLKDKVEHPDPTKPKKPDIIIE